MTAWELTTVAEDEAVAFAGTEVRHWIGLEPDTEYHEDGLIFRTLPRPPGERLATVATVNDMHFGENALRPAGRLGHRPGPVGGPG